MLSNQQITKTLSSMINNRKRGVLASVISVQGSAYKREGAKMIIESNGEYHGMISGGCLEADVVETAKTVFGTGKPLIKKYVLDEDLVWGLGLGCPGTVEIFLETINTSDIWKIVAENYRNEKAMVVCKMLKEDDENDDRLLVVTDNDVFGNWGEEYLQASILSVARQKLTQQRAVSESIELRTKSGEEVRVFFDVHFPPPNLCIFGAGHDAIPLAHLATMLGFKSTVIDPRPAYNTKNRFPNAECYLFGPEQFNKIKTIDSRTYIVIMNHHLERDAYALAFSLQSEAQYVGILGPKSRREKIVNQLKDEGISFSKDQFNKLYSPIGLDIGADTSEEIGVSILAEITAFRNRHLGGFLKEQPRIHHKQKVLLEYQT